MGRGRPENGLALPVAGVVWLCGGGVRSPVRLRLGGVEITVFATAERVVGLIGDLEALDRVLGVSISAVISWLFGGGMC